jgi:hypothetical protein
MRTNALSSMVLALGLFTGCSGSDPAATTDGAPDDAPLTMKIESEEDVRLGHALVDLPYITAYALPVEGPHTCPKSTVTNTGWVLEGGCTDDELGTVYSGRVSITRAPLGTGAKDTFVFEDFRVEGKTFWSEVDGTITSILQQSTCGFPGPSQLETDGLRLRLGGEGLEIHGGSWPGGASEVEVEFLSHRFGWNGDCAAAALESSSVVKVTGKGTLRVDSSVVDGDCSREADEGETRLRGANEATLTFKGAETCDACVDYAIDGGASGSLCWIE